MTNPALLRDRTIIRLSGEDYRPFLQGLITQNIDRLAPGKAIFTALLTPQGKILFDFFITEHDGAFLIDCFSGAAEALAKRLTLYKLRAKVTIEIDVALCTVAAGNEFSLPDAVAFPDPRHASLGWRAIATSATGDSSGAYDYRRIALGIPEFGKDFGPDEMFLLDVNYDALNAVSYKKGCFVGQEVTSRMKRKGAVRKRTVIAEFDGSSPEKGASITAGDSTIGQILGGADNSALALIRLDRWEKAATTGVTPNCDGRDMRLAIPEYLKQD